MGRRWTLEAASAMLAEVRDRTARAVASVETQERRIESGDEALREAAATEIRSAISLWMREMEALGVAVRGPWQVEFGTEEGAFCWTWPEERLGFRPEGSDEATPIQ